MNTSRITEAANRIARYKKALEWLEQYGSTLSGSDKDGFSLYFRPLFAGSCVGATEATEVINDFARYQIEEIVKAAIANCRNTIVMDREAILQEANHAE